MEAMEAAAMEAAAMEAAAAATERFRRLFVCLFVNSIPEKLLDGFSAWGTTRIRLGNGPDRADPAEGEFPR